MDWEFPAGGAPYIHRGHAGRADCIVDICTIQGIFSTEPHYVITFLATDPCTVHSALPVGVHDVEARIV